LLIFLKKFYPLLISITLIVISVLLYVSCFGRFEDLFRIGLENVIFYLLGIIILIIGGKYTDFKLNEHNKKIKLYENGGNDYHKMVFDFSLDFYILITKNYKVFKDPHTRLEEIYDAFTQLKKEIESYIDENYFEKNPVKPIFFIKICDKYIPKDELTSLDQNYLNSSNSPPAIQSKDYEYDLEELILKIKKDHAKNIDEFLSKYRSDVPTVLKDKLYEYRNQLNDSALLFDFTDFNIENGAKLFTHDFEKIREEAIDFINKLQYLLNYFDEVKKDNKDEGELRSYNLSTDTGNKKDNSSTK